jgi:hypothetical protein
LLDPIEQEDIPLEIIGIVSLSVLLGCIIFMGFLLTSKKIIIKDERENVNIPKLTKETSIQFIPTMDIAIGKKLGQGAFAEVIIVNIEFDYIGKLYNMK